MKPGGLDRAARQKTHGDWNDTARAMAILADATAELLDHRTHRGQPPLSPQQRMALEMIMTKIARIVSGDPNHPDHWDDIAGYALLGRGTPK